APGSTSGARTRSRERRRRCSSRSSWPRLGDGRTRESAKCGAKHVDEGTRRDAMARSLEMLEVRPFRIEAPLARGHHVLEVREGDAARLGERLDPDLERRVLLGEVGIFRKGV